MLKKATITNNNFFISNSFRITYIFNCNIFNISPFPKYKMSFGRIGGFVVTVNGERAASAVHKTAAVGVVNVYAVMGAICPQSCHRSKLRNFSHYYADVAEGKKVAGCLSKTKQGHPIGQPCYLNSVFSRFLCALCEFYFFFSPNFSTASSRILYFRILPAAFIGNDLTKSI